MHTDVSTPFDKHPNLSALHEALLCVWTNCDGSTLVSKSPFLIHTDGSLCANLSGIMGLAGLTQFSEFHDLWDELLLIRHGVESGRYADGELQQLETHALRLGSNVATLCEQYISMHGMPEERKGIN